jgi:hypothetical protein
MAATAALRKLARRTVNALKGYAKVAGWGPDDYMIFVRMRKSGFIHVILAARALQGGGATFMDWSPVVQYLEKKLGPDSTSVIRLAVWSFDQMNQAGIYTVSPDYTQVWPDAG